MRRVATYKEKSCILCLSSYVPTAGKQKACLGCSKTYWRQKHAEQARARGRERKLLGIEYLGGRCSSCGGTFHPSVYEFHHLNPTEKENDPAVALQKSWEKFRKELDKCVLLCANCHRLTHHTWE